MAGTGAADRAAGHPRPTVGKPLRAIASVGSTSHVTLPAIVCDWPLAFRLVASFRSKTGRALEPFANVATDGNIALAESENAGTVSVMGKRHTRTRRLPHAEGGRVPAGVGVHSVYRAVNRGELPASPAQRPRCDPCSGLSARTAPSMSEPWRATGGGVTTGNGEGSVTPSPASRRNVRLPKTRLGGRVSVIKPCAVRWLFAVSCREGSVSVGIMRRSSVPAAMRSGSGSVIHGRIGGGCALAG